MLGKLTSPRALETSITAGVILIVPAPPAGVVLQVPRVIKAAFLSKTKYLFIELRDEFRLTVDAELPLELALLRVEVLVPQP